MPLSNLLTDLFDDFNKPQLIWQAAIIVLCVVASGAYALIQLWERRSRIIESLN